MFHSRKGGHDIKRANSRFMDPRKDTHTRFRALKTLTGKLAMEIVIFPVFLCISTTILVYLVGMFLVCFCKSLPTRKEWERQLLKTLR